MEIQNLLENWHGHSGEEVENFIKDQLGNKVGYIYRFDTQKTTDTGSEQIIEDVCYILGFIDKETFESWLADEGTVDDPRVISSTEIPTIGSGYALVLNITPPASVQGSSNFNVLTTATSTYTTGGVSQEIYEPVLITIQISYDGITWTKVGTRTINSGTETEVSMDGLLPAGALYVRMYATGAYASSVAVVFQVRVMDLSLSWASLANTRERKVTDEVLTLDFQVTGAVIKTLVLQFDGQGARRQKAISLSADITGTTYRAEISPSEVQDILTAGSHKVTAFLEYYEDGVNITSNIVEAEYLVSDGLIGTVAVNDIATDLSNFTAVTFFQWFTNKDMEVRFSLIDKYTDVEYITDLSQQAIANTPYTLSTQLNIEGVENEIIYAIMYIEDAEGNSLHEGIEFTIVNNAIYSPVSGAKFILTPSIRSNSELNPAIVINSANDQQVSGENDFVNFDFTTDGWVSTNYQGSKIGVLRVPAGRSLTINYNPFAELVSSGSNSMTFEADFTVSSIIDTEEPIITIGDIDKGLIIYPDHAIMHTANLKVDNAQNVAWAENKRIHLVVSVSFGEEYSYVRIYINGILDREFEYNPQTDSFAYNNTKIIIGNQGSDIDIYGIRCYNFGITSRQVRQDYIAMMSTTEEKLAFSAANDITDASDEITWEKCLGKYNVIGHTGPLLHKGMENTKQRVTLEIRFAEGQPGNSIIMTNLENKGQGTTAMTYYWWNQQYSIKDNTQFFNIDDDEREHPLNMKGYAIVDEEPLAKKLVGKVNFASSMQSHKLGLTWAYTDLYKEMLGTQAFGNDAPSQFSIMGNNVRLAVYEKPFIFFQRENEGDPWVFRNLMTFGPGKGDKPTFGFKDSADKTHNMFMVEGADNNAQLALFNMPWDDDYIEYNPSEEAWCYKGTNTKNINFGFGSVTDDDDELPNNPEALQAIKNFFNFVYEHTTRIEYRGRSISTLPVEGNSYTTPQQWIGDGDVYRWDVGTSTWVQVKDMNGNPLKITDQYENYTRGTLSTTNTTAATESIIAARVNHFKQHASEYFHVRDALFHYCFIKFFAGTDNRAKNTYYYTDPLDLKIRWLQDDLDTVLKTNNSGANIKPYWVEEHTKDNGTNYWAGEYSGFNLLLEAAYDNDILPEGETFSIQTIMRAMMTAMSQLGKGSIMGFMEKYILSTQDYFPAVAYNAQAKWVYEYANEHDANPPVPPMTQSCGSQRWSEYQWLTDRIMFISSWCQFGEFQSGTAAGGQQWRAHNIAKRFSVTPAKWIYPRFGQGSSNVGQTALTAPGEVFTSTVTLQAGDDEVLAIRGNNYLWKMGDLDSTHKQPDMATMTISGSRLREITVNEDGSKSTALWEAPTVVVNAQNIERFIIRNANYINEVSGTKAVSSRIDLSKCVRLREVDLRGCSNLIAIDLPQTYLLTTVKLPQNLTNLILNGQINLTNFSIEGVSNLKSITIKNSPHIQSFAIINQAKIQNAQLNSVILNDINWGTQSSGIDASVLDWLTTIPTCELTGTIYVSDSTPINFEMQRRILKKWGDAIVNEDLIINYKQISLGGISIGGESYISQAGEYQYDIVPNNQSANNFNSILWTVNWKNSNPPVELDQLVVNLDEFSKTGLLKISDVIPFTSATYVLTISVTVGNISSEQWEVGLYDRHVEVGDFVYADGSWSDKYNPIKTVVGVCFFVDDTIRLMVSPEPILRSTNTAEAFAWAATNNTSGVSGLQSITVDGVSYNPYAPLANTVPAALSGSWSGSGVGGSSRAENYANGEFKTDSNIAIKTYNGMSYGEVFTKLIVEQRDIYNTAIGLPPVLNNSRQALDAAIQEAVSLNGTNYEQLYFPAFSYCHSYEPTIKSGEVLNDNFSAGHWYLPSGPEALRVRFYMREHYYTGEDKIDAFNNAYNQGMFRTALKDNLLYIAKRHHNGTNAFYIKVTDYWSYTNSWNLKYNVQPCCKF